MTVIEQQSSRELLVSVVVDFIFASALMWLSILRREMSFNLSKLVALTGVILAVEFVVGCKPASLASGGTGRGLPVFRVVVVESKVQAIAEMVPLVGTLAANESIEVKSEAEGVIQRIGFEEGAKVAAGTLLAALDTTKLAASLREMEASLELSRANLDRAKQLLSEKLISQQDFDQTSASFNVNQSGVELRRRMLKDTEIFAPFAGTIGARQVSPGQVISKATVLTTLVDLSVMKVEVSVPERFLGQILLGQAIQFSVDAFPSTLFTGTVSFISPELDSGTRTALVKARVANPEGHLRAGMFVKLDLSIRLKESALVIPEPALLSNGDSYSVFVVGPQTNAVLRPITLGIRLAGKAEVVSGLNPGDWVVVEGVKKIFPGAALQLAPASAAAAYLR